MKTRLNSLSIVSAPSNPQWKDGDSAWYGDYLAGRLSPEAVGRIYPSGTGFIVNLRFYSERGDAVTQLETASRRLLLEVLPFLEAHDVTVCEPLD